MSKRALIALGAVAAVAVGIALWRTNQSGEQGSAGDDAPAATRGESAQVAPAPKPPAPVAVAGTVVVDGTGEPIAGATVRLRAVDGDDEGVALSADDGRWAVDPVAPGTYALSASAPGFAPTARDVEVDAGAAAFELSLAAGGNAVKGTVTDVSGGPVSGAVVRFAAAQGVLGLDNARSFAALTDADGAFGLNVPDGRYRATAAHEDYVPRSQMLELRGGGREISFELAPGGVIEGVVRGEGDGKPVPGAVVSYTRERLETMPGGGRFATTAGGGAVIADGTGAFRIRGLPSGAVRLAARSDAGATVEPTVVPLAIGEQVAGVELYLERAYTISGRVVVRETGKPAPGVRVSAGGPGEGGLAATAPTTADGRFAITGAPSGRYRLRAESDEHVASLLGEAVVVDGADVSGVELEVRAGAFITGRVDPPGVAEVGVEPRMPGGDADDADDGPEPARMNAVLLGSVRTGEDGAFRFGPVLPGSLALTARAPDGRRGELELDVPAAGADGVVIALESRASVSGRVVSERGAGVANATVKLRRGGSRRLTMIVNGLELTAERAPTAEDGSFALRGLAAGDYQVEVVDEHGQALAWAKDGAAPAISLEDGEDKAGVSLRVKVNDGVLRGVVRDPDGAPAADAWVTATAAAADLGMMRGPMPREPKARRGEGEGEDEAGHDENVTETRSMVMVAESDGDGDGGGFDLGMGGIAPVLTDDRGRFEIRGLRPGEYDLAAEGLRGTARGFRARVETGSDTSVDLVALTRIDGRVVRDGKPVTQYRVELEGPSMRQREVRDDDGAFAINRVDPGAYTVRVRSAEGSGEATVEVVAGKPAEVTVELQPMLRVTGRVVDKKGAPIAGAPVVLGQGGGGALAISIDSSDDIPRTRADGRFEVRAQRGSHILVVLGEDDPRPLVVRPFEVAEGDVDLGDLEEGTRPSPPG